jgi:tRNA(Ile)-lysidine synthase TilS/MesJ
MPDGRCSRCVLSENFPGIEFDSDGVCNFCRDEIIDKTDDATIDGARREIELLFAQKSGKAEYDAVLCYSGGKDSTYTLMTAIERYRLKVLAFTLDNGYVSPRAAMNIKRTVETLGVDHFYFKPAKEAYSAIIRASLSKRVYPRSTARRISAGCQSCIWIVNNIALKTAIEKKIPFILAGFTIGQIPANGVHYKNDYAFLKESRQRPLEILRAEAGDRILPYFTIDESILPKEDSYPRTVNLLCLEDLSEARIIESISKLGWVQPDDVDGCSSNCRLNALNNYAHEREFGFSPYELELSQLVRRNQLTRAQALEKLADRSEDRAREIMRELGMSESDFNARKGRP